MPGCEFSLADWKSAEASVVVTDGTFADGPFPDSKEIVGGFAVVEVPSREVALASAAKMAVAAAVPKRYRISGPTPNKMRCSASLTGDGDVPATSARRPSAILEQGVPWRRSDD